MNATIELDPGVDDQHDPRSLSIVQEHTDQLFTFQELARLDEALTMSSRETGLRFTLYIGDLGKPTRVQAEEMHRRSGGDPAESVLIALSPRAARGGGRHGRRRRTPDARPGLRAGRAVDDGLVRRR